MLNKYSIRTKVLVILSSIAILAAGISSYLGYQVAEEALTDQAFKQLVAVREMKANHVEDYFTGISDQVLTFSENRMIIEAASAFRAAFRNLETELALDRNQIREYERQLRIYYQDQFLPRLNANLMEQVPLSDYWPEGQTAKILQHLYISANPFETGGKEALDESPDQSSYSQVHALFHPVIRSYLENFGYYDIFLIDHETGHIVYSVFKEVDFGTSLLSGPYRQTNLAKVFLAARDSSTPDFVMLADFAGYHPSYGEQASFIGSPVFEGAELVGVLGFQMPVDRINDIMTTHAQWDSVGLGRSGETYIVGEDFTVRNQSRFLIEDPGVFFRDFGKVASRVQVETIRKLGSSIGLLQVKTEGTVAALGGETGTGQFPDYRGLDVLSAFRPLAIEGVNWAIMSEMDASEALEAATSLRNRVLILLATIIILIFIVSRAFSRSLTDPIRALSITAKHLAEGDLDVEIKKASEDEIGELANVFEVMRSSFRDLVKRQADSIEALSTPLIPLHNDVVVMPVVGSLDLERVQKIRETLVEGLHETGAKFAILDLTAVRDLDANAASGIIRSAQAARLLGARVILTGLQTRLVSTLVDRDLDFEGLESEPRVE
jgi:anti-anti-sigma regulatory factor/HAMP domain-containing protein